MSAVIFLQDFSGLIIDNGWVRIDMGVPTLNCCGEHQPYQPIQCSGILMYSLLEVIGLGEIMKRGLSWEVNNLRVINKMCPSTIQTAHSSLSTSSTYFARIRREVFIYNPQLSHHHNINSAPPFTVCLEFWIPEAYIASLRKEHVAFWE